MKKWIFLSAALLLGWAVPGHCNFTSVTVTDLKSPATFYTGKYINAGDLEYTIVSTSTADGLGMEPGWTQTVNLVSASGVCNSATPLTNDLSTSTLSEPSGRQVYVPQFYILRTFTGQSVRFQITVTSGTVGSPGSGSVLGRDCSAAIDVFDYESSSVTITQNQFFTGRNANAANSVNLQVISSAAASSFGLEPWMAVHVAVVSASGSGANSAEVLPTTINMATAAQNANPIIRPQAPHIGSSVRFQLTITSASSATPLVPRTGINPSFSAPINIYDYDFSGMEVLKTPATFYTGKNVNVSVSTHNVRVIVRSTESFYNFGLEDWMRVQVDLVTSPSGTAPLSNDLNPSGTLTLTAGATTYYPDIRPERPFTSSSVRFQMTVSSSNGTVLVPRSGTNPVYSSALSIFDYEGSSVTLLRSPADFFTGKNANFNTGTNFTVISTDTALGFGLEAWMRVHVAVAPIGSAASASNEVVPTNLTFPTGAQNDATVFRPQAPHTGNSVRFQLTISSANSTTALTPRYGSNPSYTSAVNIYDFHFSSLQIVQSPPVFVVNSTVTISSGTGVKLFVVSTEPAYGLGLEDYMRVAIDLLDGNDDLIAEGVSAINPAVHLSPGATFYFPTYYPKFSSNGSQTLKFRVTITSSTGLELTERSGTNPMISTTSVGVSPGDPSRLVLLPEGHSLVRPSDIGRIEQYPEDAPFQWQPSLSGESLPIRVALTDSWSNMVDIFPDTHYLTFDPVQYLVLPTPNSGGATSWVLEPNPAGTEFEFNFQPWEVTIPITVTSVDGYTSDTIYVVKYGLPRDTIFAGPSPFNPKNGETIRFGFRVAETMGVKIRVLDIFSRQVWETSVQATADEMNTATRWNGRNGNGELVGAGVYWAVLEINGEWKSKKKFGVVK